MCHSIESDEIDADSPEHVREIPATPKPLDGAAIDTGRQKLLAGDHPAVSGSDLAGDPIGVV